MLTYDKTYADVCEREEDMLTYARRMLTYDKTYAHVCERQEDKRIGNDKTYAKV